MSGHLKSDVCLRTNVQPRAARPGGAAATYTAAMPIYEYRCESCSERFEELVRRPDDPVSCPECGGVEAERLISVFAGVGGGASLQPDHAPASHPRSAGGCCGGGCCMH
jgi:putative FmdB family regulatory protein